jgi:hypothetical protein
MLFDEANAHKQKKREEQIKRWKERESMLENNNKMTNGGQQGSGAEQRTSPMDKLQQTPSSSQYRKQTKVTFPKGCVFLAACSSGDIDEVRQHLRNGVNINTTNIDGLTALHQVSNLLEMMIHFRIHLISIHFNIEI